MLQNRAAWDSFADEFVEPGRANWAAQEPVWGIWGIPEAEIGMLTDVDGLDAVELGCGTGYVSAWLARRGARPVGIDNSPKQLEAAKMFQSEFDLRFPLIHGDAERTPFPDETFDFAISEYEAAIWCDPYRWIPEAARILRPGARLVFLGNSYVCAICSPFDEEAPIGEQLQRDHFGLHEMNWGEGSTVEFHIPHGEWIRLFHSCGFEVEELVEPRPHEDATPAFEDNWIPLEWARRWPNEEVWKVRKRP